MDCGEIFQSSKLKASIFSRTPRSFQPKGLVRLRKHKRDHSSKLVFVAKFFSPTRRLSQKVPQAVVFSAGLAIAPVCFVCPRANGLKIQSHRTIVKGNKQRDLKREVCRKCKAERGIHPFLRTGTDAQQSCLES